MTFWFPEHFSNCRDKSLETGPFVGEEAGERKAGTPGMTQSRLPSRAPSVKLLLESRPFTQGHRGAPTMSTCLHFQITFLFVLDFRSLASTPLPSGARLWGPGAEQELSTQALCSCKGSEAFIPGLCEPTDSFMEALSECEVHACMCWPWKVAEREVPRLPSKSQV